MSMICTQPTAVPESATAVTRARRGCGVFMARSKSARQPDGEPGRHALRVARRGEVENGARPRENAAANREHRGVLGELLRVLALLDAFGFADVRIVFATEALRLVVFVFG